MAELWRALVITGAIIASACGSDSESNASRSTSVSTSVTTGGAGEGGALSVVGGSGPGGSAASSGGAGGTGGIAVDPCLSVRPDCPSPPGGLAEGSGLLPIERCAFPIEQHGFGADPNDAFAPLVQALDGVTVSQVLADLNRSATVVGSVPGNPANVIQAFGWNNGDQAVDYWVPQGLTGSADASSDGLVAGREVMLASWYYDAASDPNSTGEKGVRVSLADVTDASSVTYRHLLLVEPTFDGAQPSFKAINIHAGGMVWIGDYLYVADTSHGFRVFDMSALAQVSTGENTVGYHSSDTTFYAANYKYVIPQIGNYERAGSCSPRFSFVGLDRSTSPPSLLSGEYDSGSLYGRLLHWPLVAGQRLGSGTSFPNRAFYSLHSHLQGAVSNGAKHWLSSSEPSAGKGDLYVSAEATQSQVLGWVDGPEDLVFDMLAGKLWSLSELKNERFVFAVSPRP